MDSALILVLGMHRTGTSVLTRALRCMHVEIGSVHKARFDNPKGFFEDREFVQVNEALLKALGGSWDAPPPLDLARMTSYLRTDLGVVARQLLAQKMEQAALFALKDPRTCLLVPFWRIVAHELGVRLFCLISLRDPYSCAESLRVRDCMEQHRAIGLWQTYLACALLFTRDLPRLVVSYDAMLAQPGKELERMACFLGQKVEAQERAQFVDAFLDASLCHHMAQDKTGQDETFAEAMRLYWAMLPLTKELTPDERTWGRVERLLLQVLGGQLWIH